MEMGKLPILRINNSEVADMSQAIPNLIKFL